MGRGIVRALLRDPIRSLVYGMILIKCRLESWFSDRFDDPVWQPSISSKKLAYEK
jgi:hypothetical protein